MSKDFLPQGFLAEIAGYKELDGLASALSDSPVVSIRMNEVKLSSNLKYKSVPWCPVGFYLEDRPQFTFDPAMHQGVYYVQDASSMSIYAILKELTSDSCSVRYLDVCAAPGGKTTAAVSALPKESLIVANEYDYKRAEILAENLAKWGMGGCMVSRGDSSRLRKLKGFFDIVSVDAPCSGEGMMRKDNQAVSQWSMELVGECVEKQREILANAFEALRKGGYLIYSTCTFNRHENEENLKWLIENYPVEPVAIDSLEAHKDILHGIDVPYPCYRFLPGKVEGEGLFVAVVKKTGNESAKIVKDIKRNKEKSCYANWLRNSDEWYLLTEGDEIYALPFAQGGAMLEVHKSLDVIMPGVRLATIKGKDAIPAQELALSVSVNRDAFPEVEVNYHDAIAFLQKQSFSIEAPKGYVMLTYRNMPLGFMKNLGARANNLYPKAWRILSQQIPSQAPVII